MKNKNDLFARNGKRGNKMVDAKLPVKGNKARVPIMICICSLEHQIVHLGMRKICSLGAFGCLFLECALTNLGVHFVEVHSKKRHKMLPKNTFSTSQDRQFDVLKNKCISL